MPTPPSPADRPDPNDALPAVRARVPDHVARGEISTGVIVVTGGTEYVLDFVRNLPRPNAIVARVVLPHLVMPQFIEALSTNVELYRQRFGDLPGAPPISLPPTESHWVHPGMPIPTPLPPPSNDRVDLPSQGHNDTGPCFPSDSPIPSERSDEAHEQAAGGHSMHPPSEESSEEANAAQGPHSVPAPNPPRRQNPQEIYDELKIRDEVLSGAYANAVMIGHGSHEFSFDFITNFYPQSAVSCRVYMAAGHVWRMLESLRQSWDQLRPRLGNPQPPGPAPGRPPNG